MRIPYLHRLLGSIRGGQRGQTVVWAAFAAVMVLGFTGLATDSGLYMANIRDAQKDADAAALAGAQELLRVPPGDAVVKCQEWAADNDAGEDVTCTVGDYDNDGNPDVTAEVARSQSAAFGRIVGIDSFALERNGVAEVVHAGGGHAMPWSICGIPGEEYYGLEVGEEYVVKVGAGVGEESDCSSPQTGNFQLLDVGGLDDKGDCKGGDIGYRLAIGNGGSCNVVQFDLDGDGLPDTVVPTLTGQQGKPTVVAIEDYLTAMGEDPHNWEYCDGRWDLDPEDNLECIGRYVLIPIIENNLPVGKKDVEIWDLAPAYITWWTRQGPMGQVEVHVRLLSNVWIPAMYLVGESDSEFAPLRIKLAG